MRALQDPDALIVGFYRAATGEIDWSEALGAVQSAFGARACLLQTIDLHDGRLLSLQSSPGVEEACLDYVREYHVIDPRRRAVLADPAQRLDRWNHCHEYLPADIGTADPFYQHYLAAYDTRWNANLPITLGPGLMAAFILELPDGRGVLDAEERAVAQRLGLHMREALLAHERVRRLAHQALAGHHLLQAFPYPMWLIDTDRYVLFANAPAQAEHRSEAALALRDERLVLRRTAADRDLAEQLHRLAAAAHGAVAAVDLRMAASDAPLWLHLCKLEPQVVMGAFGDRPLVLATLFDPARVTPLDPFALARMFGFTPAEARVAVRLADGVTAERLAADLGCAVSTVRSHVRQVLGKLGVARSADAVRLLRQGELLWSLPSSTR